MKYVHLMIIKNLDPFYLIPIDSIYYIITEIIDYTFILSKNKYNASLLQNLIYIFITFQFNNQYVRSI